MAPAAAIDEDEVARFSALAGQWWNQEGSFRPLHEINPLRVRYVRDALSARIGTGSDDRPLAGLAILDVGCGGGLMAEPLTRLGASVTGIDPSARKHRRCGPSRAHDGPADRVSLRRRGGACGRGPALRCGPRVGGSSNMSRIRRRSWAPAFRLQGRARCWFLQPSTAPLRRSRWPSSARNTCSAGCRAARHRWHRFVRPSELSRALRAVRRAPVCAPTACATTRSPRNGG